MQLHIFAAYVSFVPRKIEIGTSQGSDILMRKLLRISGRNPLFSGSSFSDDEKMDLESKLACKKSCVFNAMKMFVA